MSAAGEILAYEKRVNAALRSFALRTHYEAATDETPLHHLMAAEDGTLDEWGVVRQTAVRILLWLAAEGPHPGAIMKRLFVLGDHMMIEPYCKLTLREKAALLDDSHGAQLWRLKRIAVDPLMRKGCRSVKGSGQKGLRASAAAAHAQQGNSNRKKKLNEHVPVERKPRPKTKTKTKKT